MLEETALLELLERLDDDNELELLERELLVTLDMLLEDKLLIELLLDDAIELELDDEPVPAVSP